MSKLSKIDRELRKYEQLILAAEREQLAALELVCDIETMLSPTPSSKLPNYFSTFVRFTEQVVADFMPPGSTVSARPYERPTHASSIGVISIHIPGAGVTTDIELSLDPCERSPINELAAPHLMARFNACHTYHDPDGHPYHHDTCGECRVSSLLDPNQYAVYITSMLPQVYWGPHMAHKLANLDEIVGAQL